MNFENIKEKRKEKRKKEKKINGHINLKKHSRGQNIEILTFDILVASLHTYEKKKVGTESGLIFLGVLDSSTLSWIKKGITFFPFWPFFSLNFILFLASSQR